MGNYTIQRGDTLSEIVAKKYNLKKWSEIKAAYTKIAEINKISNPNLIFAGASLNLPTSINSVFEAKKPENETKDSAEIITDETPKITVSGEENPKTSPFNDWCNECADSIADINEKGDPVYSKDVKPFDMAGEEFTNAVKAKNFEKVGEIYKQNALKTAKEDIALTDTDGDRAISPEEQVERDKSETEKKYGPFDSDFLDKMQTISLRTNLFMDLDKNRKVDEKEYAAFLYAMDSNNYKKTANGKITRDEYDKTTAYFVKPLTEEAGTFRGTVRACFKKFFGFDPGSDSNK